MVTKFITVAKVTKGGWVEGERGDRLPLEAAMLLGLSHPGLHLVLSLEALQCYLLWPSSPFPQES